MPCFDKIAVVEVAIAAIKDCTQILCTVYRAADAFQRTGADESGCFTDKKDAAFPAAEIPEGGGAQDQAGFCFQRLAEAETKALQLFLLPLETCPCALHGERSAKYELAVLGDRP